MQTPAKTLLLVIFGHQQQLRRNKQCASQDSINISKNNVRVLMADFKIGAKKPLTALLLHTRSKFTRDILSGGKDLPRLPYRIDRHSVPINTNHDENSASPSCSGRNSL
jgi:hypothetical protein